MRASAIDRVGGSEQIHWREVPDPEAGPDTVVVRTEAAAVDHVDTLIRSGAWSTELRFPQAIGHDVVGTVVDPGGTGFARGDRVWTNSAGYDGRPGASAELVALDTDRVYRAPADAEPVSFAALLHSGATVHGGFDRVGLAQGETVAVAGANGAVGLHAVGVAARRACRVIALVRRSESEDALRRAGAHEVIVADGDTALTRAAGSRPIDLLVETTGRIDLSSAPDALAPRGRILLLTGRDPLPLTRADVYLHELRIQGFIMSAMRVDELAAAASAIADDWSSGLRIPTITRPLSELREAHEALESGGAERTADGLTPKIVLVP